MQYLGSFYMAITYNDIVHEHEVESLGTTALRHFNIGWIMEGFLSPSQSVDDQHLLAVTQLIAAEVMARNGSSLAFHEPGLEKMIQLRRGLGKINTVLASVISWISLESAILRQAQPREMYHDFCRANATKDYSVTATVPESPLYIPRARPFTLEKSTFCGESTVELLKSVGMMMDIFIHEVRLVFCVLG